MRLSYRILQSRDMDCEAALTFFNCLFHRATEHNKHLQHHRGTAYVPDGRTRGTVHLMSFPIPLNIAANAATGRARTHNRFLAEGFELLKGINTSVKRQQVYIALQVDSKEHHRSLSINIHVYSLQSARRRSFRKGH